MRETEERYRLAARATNDIIWDWRMADGHVVWNEALGTLRRMGAKSKKGDYLYSRPWYMIIGPPGTGKTTALVNSGLKFLVSDDGSAQALAGVGGSTGARRRRIETRIAPPPSTRQTAGVSQSRIVASETGGLSKI